jgi:hypothetical protein
LGVAAAAYSKVDRKKKYFKPLVKVKKIIMLREEPLIFLNPLFLHLKKIWIWIQVGPFSEGCSRSDTMLKDNPPLLRLVPSPHAPDYTFFGHLHWLFPGRFRAPVGAGTSSGHLAAPLLTTLPRADVTNG